MPPATSEIAEVLYALVPHDVEDVVAVLRAQRGRFDATRTKQALADLAEVLEDPDLVSRFDAVIRRAR